MEEILKINNITKEYQMGEVTVKALQGISLSIYSGEFIVMLGPSGSGKSTLLNIIGGIDFPTAGEIFYHNEKLNGASDKHLTQYRRNAVGFVFQFYNLIPNLTSFENIKIATDIAKDPLDIDELLARVDLLDKKNNFPSQLSGGQQQRVAIARAIAKNPDLLLCDEPTGALDFQTGIQVLQTLKNFNMHYKRTVIIITHNAPIAQIADRIFYMKDGLIEKIINNKNPVSPLEVVW